VTCSAGCCTSTGELHERIYAPYGTPGGLPVGAQIVGPRYEDDTTITFAELLGEVAGGYEPRARLRR
jgi:Asp-tRNA(Asn)/Glu-tRNA(Gln) amidotransferase A subunit family amidase